MYPPPADSASNTPSHEPQTGITYHEGQADPLAIQSHLDAGHAPSEEEYQQRLAFQNAQRAAFRNRRKQGWLERQANIQREY